MQVDTRTLPAACREHIDGINQALAAGDFADALVRSYQYFRARAAVLYRKDPDGAAAFRRQAAYRLATLASEVHRAHALDEFRFSVPLVPGGDWAPES